MSALPVRTCIGCRRRAPWVELSRFRLDRDSNLVMDSRGSGRGAWLCTDSTACFTAAVRRRAFGKAFRRQVNEATVAQITNAFERPVANVKDSILGPLPGSMGK